MSKKAVNHPAHYGGADNPWGWVRTFKRGERP